MEKNTTHFYDYQYFFFFFLITDACDTQTLFNVVSRRKYRALEAKKTDKFLKWFSRILLHTQPV